MKQRFWKRWLWQTEKTLTELQFDELLTKLARALEIRHLSGPQAVADAQLAAAVRDLIESCAGIAEASFKVGSILVLKTSGRLVVQTLSPMQVAFLEQNPQVLTEPTNLLKKLQASRLTRFENAKERSKGHPK